MSLSASVQPRNVTSQFLVRLLSGFIIVRTSRVEFDCIKRAAGQSYRFLATYHFVFSLGSWNLENGVSTAQVAS
jgi:hypothetical protein